MPKPKPKTKSAPQPKAKPPVKRAAKPKPPPSAHHKPAPKPTPPLPLVTATVLQGVDGLWAVDVAINHGDQTVVRVNGRAVWLGTG